MNTQSRLFRVVAITGLMFLATSYTSMANAAEGCGLGYHRAINGRCIMNYPGPFATPAPRHPGCWRNVFGYLRCY